MNTSILGNLIKGFNLTPEIGLNLIGITAIIIVIALTGNDEEGIKEKTILALITAIMMTFVGLLSGFVAGITIATIAIFAVITHIK